jgi:hypothetical protein
MKYQSILAPSFLALTVILSGCASNPGIVKTSDDTYKLVRTDKGGSFGDVPAAKADMVRQANDFAANQGKVVVPITMKEEPLAVQGFTSIEYQFQIADKSAAVVQAAVQAKRNDGMLTKTADSTASARMQDRQDHPKDMYTELIKLDELRKRGILTEAEFDSEKKKVLNNN